MKTFLLALILLLGTLPAFANPAMDAAHKTTHTITQKVLVGGGGKCSATAIAPHALLTASHCEKPTGEILIDGTPAHILIEPIRDGFDHSVLIVDATFANYAEFAYAEPKVGDDIFIFGNAGSQTDLLRKGYVAKLGKDEDPYLYDFNGWMGDSGAGIFNAEGKLVGVVSIGNLDQPPDGREYWPTFKLMGAYGIEMNADAVKALRELKFEEEKK